MLRILTIVAALLSVIGGYTLGFEKEGWTLLGLAWIAAVPFFFGHTMRVWRAEPHESMIRTAWVTERGDQKPGRFDATQAAAAADGPQLTRGEAVDRPRSWAMRLMQFVNPTLTWRGLVALALITTVGGSIAYEFVDPLGLIAARESIESKLRVGLTEADVIRLLGESPTYRYEKAGAPADYYVDGWARRERPITGSVLIFMLGEPICYVWLDEQGRVEDSFVGGS